MMSCAMHNDSKEDFAEIFKNLARYKSENNFGSTRLCRKLKRDEQCKKSSNQLEHIYFYSSRKLFPDLYLAKFFRYFSKINLSMSCRRYL